MLEPSKRSMCWRRCAWSARMDAQGEPEKTHMGHPRMAFGKIAGGSRRESRTSTPTESPAENLEPTLTVLESPLLDLDNRPRTLDSRSFGNSLHLLTGLPRASGTGFPLSTGSTAAGTARSWGGSFKGMTLPRRQSIWPEGVRPPRRAQRLQFCFTPRACCAALEQGTAQRSSIESRDLLRAQSELRSNN